MYEYDQQDLWNFARSQHTENRQRGQELEFKQCPFCHGKGRGNEWKFSINVDTGLYKCLRASCGASGNMVDLAKYFGFKLSNALSDEYLNHRKEFKDYQQPTKPFKPTSGVVSFFKTRGISQSVLDKYEVYEDENHSGVIRFPFYDEKGVLQYTKSRLVNYDKTKHSNKEWCDPGHKPILFGMKQCNTNNGYVVITEGQIDQLSLAEAGIQSAVSVPMGKNAWTWLPYCYDWINQFQTIVVFGDNENGEITLVDSLRRAFSRNRIKCVRPADYKGCKDANEILLAHGKAHLRDCVKNAEPLSLKRVKKMSEVIPKDPRAIRKLKTGITEQDILLNGGLQFGWVHIITGKTGKGKTTFASQILVKAVEAKHRCFVYSGEMEDWRLQEWFHRQIAGPNHIVVNQMPDGSTYSLIVRQKEEKIISWYEPYLWLYSNDIIEDDEEDDLIRIVDEVIRQYGIEVVLLDNLMTGLELTTEKRANKFEKQERFIKRLAALAQRSGVLILLVAHQKKGDGEVKSTDDILGASEIPGLAGSVLRYDTYTKEEIDKGIGREEDRKLLTLKDRDRGMTNLNGFNVMYDEKSKRIYGEKDDLNHDYGWQKENDGFMETDENPFA